MSGHLVTVAVAPTRVSDRVIASVTVADSGCWLTPYALHESGYVKVGWSEGGRKTTSLGHIVTYERVNGPVSPGLELDHLCRNKACVNPAHLEPVPTAENLLRSPVAPAAVNRRKTHCPQGHRYDDENTYVFRSGRACKTCMAENTRKHRALVPPKPRRRKTHCYRGHPYDEVNTYVDKRGRRLCRECGRIQSREYQRRGRAAT